MDILELAAEGLSIRAISERSGHSRNTVRKVLRGEQLEQRKPRSAQGKIEPFTDYIKGKSSRWPVFEVFSIERLKKDQSALACSRGSGTSRPSSASRAACSKYSRGSTPASLADSMRL